MRKGFLFKFAFAIVLLGAACGVNSVTKAQLEAVKPGDVLVYRYQKEGKSWFYADKITKIEGDKIIVWNDDIQDPMYVRYAWADNPVNPNLYNKQGLPASPFRTDSP